MSIDLFEQLASQEVPPPPENLTSRVHQQLNRTLVVLHTVEFALWVLPMSAVSLCRAVLGLLHLTITGRYPLDRTPRSTDDGRNE